MTEHTFEYRRLLLFANKQYMMMMKMSRNQRFINFGEAMAIASVILSALLQCAGAQSTTNTTVASNTTVTYQYNKLTKFTHTTTLIILILIILFFLLSSVIIYNRPAAINNPVGIITRRGLSQTILNTFPTFAYSQVKSHKIGKSVLECAICLNEFADDETLSLIPKCDHVFHPECIHSWLRSHTTCPVCRADLDEATPYDATPTIQTASQSGPQPTTVESRADEATTIDIAELPMTEQPKPPIDCTKAPNRLTTDKTIFFHSKLSRSHSTGHLLDRFTLILPIEIKNQIINRVMNRSNRDLVLTLESSLRKGYRIRTGGEEGSGRGGCSGPIGFGLFGRPSWNYNRDESFQKLGLRKN